MMRLSFEEIFKYSDVLNPISPNTLYSAGKLAKFEPEKLVLDLGSGKGSPSILWASLFGVQVEGYDFMKKFVEYANSRAKILNLSNRVKFFCKDIKELNVNREYEVVASLGLGIAHIFGSVNDGFKNLKTMLRKNGFLIFAEPVWLVKDVPSDLLENLDVIKEHFLTKSELQRLMENHGFQIKGIYESTKEDWELYIQPVNYAMSEIIENHTMSEFAAEAQKIINGFKAEYDAVLKYWNMVLWVAKASYSIG